MMVNNNCQVTIGQYVEQYRESTRHESKNKTKTFSLTTTQDELLRRIAEEKGVGVSTLIGDIVGSHLELSPHINTILDLNPHFLTIERHRDVVLALLKSLS